MTYLTDAERERFAVRLVNATSANEKAKALLDWNALVIERNLELRNDPSWPLKNPGNVIPFCKYDQKSDDHLSLRPLSLKYGTTKSYWTIYLNRQT